MKEDLKEKILIFISLFYFKERKTERDYERMFQALVLVYVTVALVVMVRQFRKSSESKNSSTFQIILFKIQNIPSMTTQDCGDCFIEYYSLIMIRISYFTFEPLF